MDNKNSQLDTWLAKGKTVLNEDKWQLWDDEVITKWNGVYGDLILREFLEVATILNNSGSLEKVAETMKYRSHSGGSFKTICSMIERLCDGGHEVVKYLKTMPI